MLRDVSLAVHPGELAAVGGGRSSGKSTLASLAAGVLPADAGDVLLFDRSLSRMNAAQLAAVMRTEVGFASKGGPTQRGYSAVDWLSTVLCDRTTWRKARGRSLDMLGRVGVSDVANSPWENLSDTERTLVSLAHALVREPKLLIGDELTVGLDILERGQIVGLLRSLAADTGTAVLITTGDLGEVQGASPIWSLAGGSLVGPRPMAAGALLKFPLGKP